MAEQIPLFADSGAGPLIRNCAVASPCQQQWADMMPALDRRHRFCVGCKRQVTLCETDEQLLEELRQNSCVAIPMNLRRERFSMDDAGHMVGEPLVSGYDSEGTSTE